MLLLLLFLCWLLRYLVNLFAVCTIFETFPFLKYWDWVKKCMEYEVEGPSQEEDQRGPGERLSERTVKLVN